MNKDKLKRELYKALSEKEKQVERSRLNRTLIAIAVYSVLFFIMWFFIEKPKGIDIIGMLFAAIFFGGISFWVNAIIFGILNAKTQEENKALEQIKSKISELEGRTSYDDDEW